MCASSPSLPPPVAPSRRNGKIAKLPIEQRDTLNHMLADGATSAVIIDHFRALKVDLNPTNITNWKEGGFQDWLRHQEALHDLQNDGELAALLGTGADETAFHKGVLRMAMTRLFKALRTNQLEDDPVNYNRLLTNLARLSRESLALRKHLDSVSGPTVDQAPMLDPHRPLTDEERNAILDKLDEIMGFSTKKPTPPPPLLTFDSTPKTPELKPIQADSSQASSSRSSERPFAPIGREPKVKTNLPPAPKSTPKDDDLGFIGAEAPHTSPEEKAFLKAFCAPVDSQPIHRSSESDFAPSKPLAESSPAEVGLAVPCEPSEKPSPICGNPSLSVIKDPSDSLVVAAAPSSIFLEPSAQAPTEPERCAACNTPTPPLLPNGERPSRECAKCGSALPPPPKSKAQSEPEPDAEPTITAPVDELPPMPPVIEIFPAYQP